MPDLITIRDLWALVCTGSGRGKSYVFSGLAWKQKLKNPQSAFLDLFLSSMDVDLENLPRLHNGRYGDLEDDKV